MSSNAFTGRALKINVFSNVDIVVKTNRLWFSVVCSLIDNDTRHHSGLNLYILTTVMTRTRCR